MVSGSSHDLALLRFARIVGMRAVDLSLPDEPAVEMLCLSVLIEIRSPLARSYFAITVLSIAYTNRSSTHAADELQEP
jgi:hypothetical protein